jgi:hypothetical protein
LVEVLMRRPKTRATLIVFATLLGALAFGPPAGAQAAKPVPVAITSPAAGSTGTGRNLTISGTARGATSVFVTIGDDINTYQASVSKSTWSTFVNEQPAGTSDICAEAYDGAAFLGRTCIPYTVEVDGIYLSLFPEDGSTVQSTFTAVGGCHGGSTVRLTLDGSPVVLPCTEFSFQQEYVAVPEGSHTLTAEQLSLDGSTVVATVTRTFTSMPIPVATVVITDPPDGATSGLPQVVFSGTAASNVDATIRLYVDGVFASATTAVDGAWSDTLNLPWGQSQVCAEMSDFQGRPIATDCVAHTVTLDPSSLSITSPVEGESTFGTVLVQGTCVLDLLVTIELDGQTAFRFCEFDQFSALFDGVAGGPQTVVATMRATEDQVVTTSVSFTVDTVAPAAPVVTSPEAGTTIKTRFFLLSGTAEPGSTVELYTPSGVPFYSAGQADADGVWVIGVGEDFLAEAGVLTGKRGTLTLTVDAIDQFGNTSPTVTVTYATRIR